MAISVHVVGRPAAMAVAELTPVTVTGVRLFVVVPGHPTNSHRIRSTPTARCQAGFWPTQCQLRVSSSSSSAWMYETLLAFMRCINASVFFGIRCSVARNLNTAS